MPMWSVCKGNSWFHRAWEHETENEAGIAQSLWTKYDHTLVFNVFMSPKTVLAARAQSFQT